MARDDNATDQDQDLLKTAYTSGLNAANKGCDLADEETLMDRNGYSIEQAREYIKGYKSSNATSQMKKIRKARTLADSAIERGNICPDENEVRKKYPKFSEDEVAAYLEVIAKKKPSKEILVRNKASKNAREAVNRGLKGTVTIPEVTTKFNFSREEAELYVEEFNKVYNDTINTQKALGIDKSKALLKLTNVYNSGMKAARKGIDLADEKTLMSRNKYSIEQARAYIQGFQSFQSTSDDTKKIRKAKNFANKAIERGNILTDKNEVVKQYPHFSEAEVQAYLGVIATKNPSKETLVRNKASRNAREAANKGYGSIVTTQEIIAKFNFSREEAELYVEEYNKRLKGKIKTRHVQETDKPTHEAKNKKQSKKAELYKKAHELGKKAAASGSAQPTADDIREEYRDFTYTEARVYLKAFGEVARRRRDRDVASGSGFGVNEAIAMEGLVSLSKGQDGESSRSISTDENRMSLSNP